jgi:hypothetical protein
MHRAADLGVTGDTGVRQSPPRTDCVGTLRARVGAYRRGEEVGRRPHLAPALAGDSRTPGRVTPVPSASKGLQL